MFPCMASLLEIIWKCRKTFKVLCKHTVNYTIFTSNQNNSKRSNICCRMHMSIKRVIVLIMKLPFPIGLHNCSNSTLSSVDLKTVPADIPLDIVRLDLSRNNIKQLRPKEFVNVKDLKLLNMSGNSLESIDTGKPMVHNQILSWRHILIWLLYKVQETDVWHNMWQGRSLKRK